MSYDPEEWQEIQQNAAIADLEEQEHQNELRANILAQNKSNAERARNQSSQGYAEMLVNELGRKK